MTAIDIDVDIDIDQPDPTAVDGLDRVLARLAPVLEEFGRYAGPDATVTDRAQWLSVLDRDLPADGAGLETVLDELELAVRYGCRIGHPGFSGFITTTGSTAPVAAALGVSAAGGQRYLLHAFNALEHTGLRWLAEICGIPASWRGVFTSGGSSANVVALAAARQHAYERIGVDPAADGLAGAPAGRLYASAEAHRTIHRSAAVLGLGRDAVVEIPVDDRQRLQVTALEAAIARDVRAGLVPVAVVAVAGTTNTGAIDPIAEVVDVGRRHGAWVHVDGAYGLVAACDPEVAPQLAAVRDADSAIVDPHKWMATGIGVGAAYVRDVAVLHRALTEGEAVYLEGRSRATSTVRPRSSTAWAGPGPTSGSSSRPRPAARSSGRCCASSARAAWPSG